jgi:hypothetical protein
MVLPLVESVLDGADELPFSKVNAEACKKSGSEDVRRQSIQATAFGHGLYALTPLRG